MFKKRGPPNKKLDLQQEAENIQPTPHAPETPQDEYKNPPLSENSPYFPSRTPVTRPKSKVNSITLQGMETSEIKQEKQNQREYIEVGKEEISDCLNEIRKMKATEVIQDEEHKQPPQIRRMNEMKLVQEYKNGNSYDSDYDDNQMLEVEEDLEGGFSPERDSDPYHEDYEDQLIRRTLTKHNYDRLQMRGGPHLGDLKAIEVTDKLFEKVQKVSAKRIQNTIRRDLQIKKRTYAELMEGIRLKKGGIEREQKEVQRKQKRLGELRTQLQRVNKVIEYLYYYGDKVQVFEMGAILRQANQKDNQALGYKFEDVQ